MAVALVVINRTLDGRFNPRGYDLCKVARQPKQFAKLTGSNAISDSVAQSVAENYGTTSTKLRSLLYFNRSHKGGIKIGRHTFYS